MEECNFSISSRGKYLYSSLIIKLIHKSFIIFWESRSHCNGKLLPWLLHPNQITHLIPLIYQVHQNWSAPYRSSLSTLSFFGEYFCLIFPSSLFTANTEGALALYQALKIPTGRDYEAESLLNISVYHDIKVGKWNNYFCISKSHWQIPSAPSSCHAKMNHQPLIKVPRLFHNSNKV